MDWLDKFIGKGKPGGDRPGERQPEMNAPSPRPAGDTVLRPGAAAAPRLAGAQPGGRLLPGHRVSPELEIKELLGSGAMGNVYLARHRLWNVDVALKIPNEKILADTANRHRILREAHSWTDLGLHPHIAYCYYTRAVGDLLLLVIEYADGGNLRNWIGDGRCAELKTGLDLAIQFCHGLEHAHKANLVHRDVKPENILMMKDGTLKITDFGIVSRRIDGAEAAGRVGAMQPAAAAMTVVGIGTPSYMAPEQRDREKLNSSADIFAFGICLYEMLCGSQPYSITEGPRQEAPDPGHLRGGKGLPVRLSRLMKRCVDWEPKNRPGNAKEVRLELCAIYQEMCGSPSSHAEVPEMMARADDWNNRALSYLSMGREEDAEKAWKTALEADPRHPESTYNYGLYRWRGAQTTDQEIVANMRGVADSDETAWLPRYLLAYLHMEREDVVQARAELAKIQGEANVEVVAAQAAVGNLTSSSQCVREFEEIYRFASMTPDGRLAFATCRGNNAALYELGNGRCVRRFDGHIKPVSAVCISPDGRLAVSGSEDKTLRLWDATTGTCLRVLEGHTGEISSIAMAIDGAKAVSGSADKTLKLWDLASGRCLHTFEGDKYRVRSVCLSLDGRFALAGGSDNTLKLWDVESSRLLRTFVGHTSNVDAVCLSADGHLVLSGSSDHTVKLWDVESGRLLRTFVGHTNTVTSVCFTADGSVAVSGSQDKTVRLWDVESGRCLRTLEGHTGQVESVGVRSDGRMALSASLGGAGRLWEIGTFSYRAGFRLSQMTSSAESIGAAGRFGAAMASARKAASMGNAVLMRRSLLQALQQPGHRRAAPAIREWGGLYPKLRRGGQVDCWMQWSAHHQGAQRIALSPDGASVLSGSIHGTLEVRDTSTGRCVHTMKAHTNLIYAVCLTDGGRLALSGGMENTVRLSDVSNGKSLRTLAGHTDRVNAVSIGGDGRFALSGSKDRTLKLWDVNSGHCLRTFQGHTSDVCSVCLSGDGRYALSGSFDKTLRLWDVVTGQCIRTFEGHQQLVESVSFSADCNQALSGGWDATLKLWNIESGRCVRTFEGHTEVVETVCFTADGRFALSGSRDKTIRLWDVESGRCLRTQELEEHVESVGLSADGQYAIAVCRTGIITAWFLDWELEENEPADWDERARPYLEVFLRSRQPYGADLPKDRPPTPEEVTRALTRIGRPRWNHEDWLSLLRTLQYAGFGWLRPDAVGLELERMAAEWGTPRKVTPPQYVNTAGPVGRNDPCPCGSGKKYKKCHGL